MSVNTHPKQNAGAVTSISSRETTHRLAAETVRGVREIIDAPYSEVRIPDSGHRVPQEAAEIVNAALREFLAD